MPEPVPAAPRRSLYWALLAIQSFGAAFLYWKGVPLYRVSVSNALAHETRSESLLWLLGVILPIQTAYWLRHRLRLSLPGKGPALLAQVVQFAGRLLFVLATTVFSYAFILKFPTLMISTLDSVLLLTAFFSLFCYTQELDRLGKALQGS